MQKKNQYDYEALVGCGNGNLFGGLDNAKLPLPPMLMFDRITNISEATGIYNNGSVAAELDINKELWFFKCHFRGDPVMPGCLGLDAMWQLVGFYLCWIEDIRANTTTSVKARAVGVNNVKFSGEVLESNQKVVYEINIRKILRKKNVTLGLADGLMFVDGKKYYEAIGLKTGLFYNNAQ